MKIWTGAMVIVCLALAVPVAAQQRGVKQVASPYQASYAYRVGETLDPGVALDGIRWDVVRVQPQEGEALTGRRQVVTEVDLRFSNPGTRKGRMLVILLFETQEGESLGRIEFSPVKIQPGRVTEEKQRFKLDAELLNATRRIYVFCELRG